MMFYEFNTKVDLLARAGFMITEEIPTFQEYKQWIEPVYQDHPLFDDVHGKDQAAMLYAAFGIMIFIEMFYEIHPEEVRHGNLL